MLQIAGGGDEEISRLVALPNVAAQIVRAHAGHRLHGSLNGPPQGVIRPELLHEKVEEELIGGVIHHPDLLEDHTRRARGVQIVVHRRHELLAIHPHGLG